VWPCCSPTRKEGGAMSDDICSSRLRADMVAKRYGDGPLTEDGAATASRATFGWLRHCMSGGYGKQHDGVVRHSVRYNAARWGRLTNRELAAVRAVHVGMRGCFIPWLHGDRKVPPGEANRGTTHCNSVTSQWAPRGDCFPI
jgi:hypothetical protein